MLKKKNYFKIIDFCNWVIVGLGAIIIVAYITPLLNGVPSKDSILFLLSFITLLIIGISLIISGVGGLWHHELSVPSRSLTHINTVKGKRAGKLGLMFLVMGVLLIIGLIYAVISTKAMQQQLREEHTRKLKEYQPLEQRDLPDQPPHFISQ